MSTLSHRILQAVDGDTRVVQGLANAIAGNDAAAVRAILAARGVEVSEQECGQVIGLASGEQGPGLTVGTWPTWPTFGT